MSRAILVVDDEADLVTTYERVLRRHGHHVVSAGSRHAGLMALGSQPLDLVVADVRLGDGDGLDVVRAARANPTPPPVIVVTGYTSATGRRDALDAGAAAYLAKPFSISQFIGAVETVLGRPASAAA
jgi:two-component system, NtrC family, response regulator PilR